MPESQRRTRTSSLSLSRVIRHLSQSRLSTWLLMFVVVAIITTLLNVYFATTASDGRVSDVTSMSDSRSSVHTKPPSSGSIITLYVAGHVITVFSRVGYSQGGPLDGWDVLWSHQYPFQSLPPETWRNLKPHQKVNHFPGTGCFTSKPRLATLEFPFIPKAFQLPRQADDFKKEAAEHPDLLWVQKSSKHRGIKIKNIASINLRSAATFVQQFISNPLLIDGRKFDIGVYTVITSVDPLRVYVYQEEILVRFCSKNYYPFSASDPKKYVVDDDYTHASELPSMSEMVNKHKFSDKQALNAALRNKGYSPDNAWHQVYHVIQEILLHCEPSILKAAATLVNDTRYFFELVRFDFVIDEDLKAWLMEVNLSPNLSSDHFPANRFMYEQVLFNVLNLIGLVRGTDQSMRYNGHYESIMLVNDRDIQVPLDDCTNGQCDNCSKKLVCKLCKTCRTERESFELKTAFLEHVSRRNFRRLFPNSSLRGQLSSSNEIMRAWFDGKCRIYSSWCIQSSLI